MKVGVIINRHASVGRDEAVAREVSAEFISHGLAPLTSLSVKDEVAASAERLLKDGVDLLVAGGGDGTISTIAQICKRESIPLGVLPLGTHNHFCRDLGLPLQIAESIACIARGDLRRVDLGSLNGQTFINNSSIGAYPRAVEQREELRSRFRLRKHVAGIVATLRTFSQRPVVDAEIQIDDQRFHCTSPFVFVGNNSYSISLFAVQHRASLTEGQLSVYTARCNGISGLVRLLWLSLWNRLEQSRDFETHCGRRAVIRLRKPLIRVAKDGEVFKSQTPLHYEILPGALQVFAPKIA